MKKFARQRKILQLIEKYEIETQYELAHYLRKSGIEVTQATVSRDIKELRLAKVLTKNAKYKYAVIQDNKELTNERLMKIFKNSIIDINIAGHILVIKTLPGAAQVCASAVDVLKVEEIVGTIAGDDTIFIAVKNKDKITFVLDIFKKLLN